MLLATRRTTLSPSALVSESGRVFAVFDERTQDSGNISYSVHVGDRRFFVKTAGVDSSAASVLSQEQRVQLLRNAVRLHESLTHPALPSLRNVVESDAGPILVYDWIEGEFLRSRAFRGSRELLNVVQRAVSLTRSERYPTVEALSAAWAGA